MSTLKKVYDYLQKIKNGTTTFQLLLNKGLKGISEKEMFLIKDSLKSIINRYHFLSWEQSKIINIDNEDLKDYFICALGQYHYVKDVKDKDLLEAFKEDVPTFDTELTIADLYNAILGLCGSIYKISDKEYSIIIKRLAINYAYPEWAVKLMSKHFGIKHTYRAIASSRKNININLNYNSFLTSKDKVINTDPESFKNGNLALGSISYEGKKKIIDLELFKKNKIFPESEAMQMLVEKLSLEPGDESLLIAEDQNAAAIDMAMHMKDVGVVHACVKNVVDNATIKNMIHRFKLNSINVFQSEINTLLTHVGKESCDKVLYVADSTELGLVRRRPAVLLTLKRDDLDNIISSQKEGLEEVSSLVKKGGTLIYSVFTYNKKESNFIIEEFLSKHDDFELIEEKQIFAHEVPSDGLYYAILKKK